MGKLIDPNEHELVIVSNGMTLEVYENGERVRGIKNINFTAGTKEPPITLMERVHNGQIKPQDIEEEAVQDVYIGDDNDDYIGGE